MNKKVLIGSGVIISAILALLLFATPGATGVEVTVSEIVNEPETFRDKYILVSGNLVSGSASWDSKALRLSFAIEDEAGAAMDVTYVGAQPDNFDDDVIVILDGKYDVDNQVFVAEKLRTRCPSKYEGEHPDEMQKQY